MSKRLAKIQYLDLDKYQANARNFATYKSPLYPVLGLAEEAGEVAGKYAKYLRGDKKLNPLDIAKELGDCLWMIANVAEELGISLSTIAAMNIEKLGDRLDRGVIKGDGDNR